LNATNLYIYLCGIPDITFQYQEKGGRNYEEVFFFLLIILLLISKL
jgi:hypothetical protein